MSSYFVLHRAELVIRPRSPAYATVFWFLYGVDPYKITMTCEGEVRWHLLVPFRPIHGSSATLHRDGTYRGRLPIRRLAT